MGIIKFGSKFEGRPVKSAGKRRQRIKAQKKRLVAAGMKEDAVIKLNILETRQAIRRIKNGKYLAVR